MQKRTELFWLIVLMLTAAGLGFAILTRGHVWGDDFAAYLMQAQSVLDGSTRAFIQRNAFTIDRSSYLLGPVAYPWGYPLLLAPVLAIFGLKALALKAVNVLFFAGFLLVFQRLARLRLPPVPALLLTAVFAFNPALIQAHDLILTDIPFLFFSTLAIYLIEKDGEADLRPASAVAIGAAIYAAFATRTNGVLLLAALATAQLVRYRGLAEMRKNLTPILLPYLAFGLLYALGRLLLPEGQGSYFSHYVLLTPTVLLQNFFSYLILPAALFADVPLGSVFGALLVLGFLRWSFASARRNAAFLAYILLTLAAFITWPEPQGLRFLYPILPLMLLIVVEGAWSMLKRIPAQRQPLAQRTGAALAGALLVLSLVTSARLGWINLQNGREINGPFDPVSGEMFEFVREQTAPESVVVFFKPRALRLFTDRDAFLSTTCEGFKGADYVVLHEKQGANGQVANPSTCGDVNLKVVFNNLRFTVYQISQ